MLKYILTILITALLSGFTGYQLAPEPLVTLEAVGSPIIEAVGEQPTFTTTNLMAEKLEATNVVKETNATGTTIIFDYKGESLMAQTDEVGYNNCRNGVWGISTVTFCKEMHEDQVAKNMQWAVESEESKKKAEALVDYSSELIKK